ncbi:MAG TPA: hypothetical protein VGA69_12690 [Nitriliruptorales bacterium]
MTDDRPSPDASDVPDAPETPGAPEAPEAPEFGPGGYLPPRAAGRARKIVLRAELGIQWVIASVVAGIVLLVVGALWWRSTSALPDRYVRVVEAALVEPSAAHQGHFAVRAGGRIRVFEQVDPSLMLCLAPGWLEARVGGEVRIWSVTGRALDGGAPLAEYHARIVDGVVYADTSAPFPAPAGTDRGVEPACLTDPA